MSPYSLQQSWAGLDVFDINYRELYNPTELVFEDILEHMDIPERIRNHGYIVKQINEYP